jgi:D-glycero-alpha-D-manno-heptose 1-phosphate guanylyltransferase
MDSIAHCTAVILAGGLGTRLRSVMPDRPKVLAEIRGRPFLIYLLDQLVEAGLTRTVLCTGYQGDQVQAALGDEYRGMELAYSPEPELRGTAGALSLALPMLATEWLLVMNGDSYCAVDLAAAWKWHQTRPARATLVLVEMENANRYGRVRLDPQQRIVEFLEKDGVPTRSWINAGIYCLARSQLLALPPGRPTSLEHEVFPRWIGQSFYGYRARAPFLDIGTPESWAEADRFMAGLPTLRIDDFSHPPACRACVPA